MQSKVQNTNIDDMKSDFKEQESVSFSQQIWARCLQSNLPQTVLSTKFTKGLKHGTLSVDSYARFFLQDIPYLHCGSKLWSKTARVTREQQKLEIAEYCETRSKRWAEYASYYATKWSVKCDGIVIGDAMQAYIEYEEYVVNKYGAEYIFVAFHACHKLWCYIATSVKSSQQHVQTSDSANLYQFWIDANLSDKSAVRNEQWLDRLHHQNKIDAELAFEIISNCLKLEINFIKDSCDEKVDAIHLYAIKQADDQQQTESQALFLDSSLLWKANTLTRSRSA